MFKNRTIILLALFCFVSLAVFAQEAAGTVNAVDNRLNVYFNMKAEGFRLTSKAFTQPDIRVRDHQNTTLAQLPLTNINYWDDSSMSVEYNGNNYGGKFSLTAQALKSSSFGGMKGWLQIGRIRTSIGNDIESTFADALGADPVLRIYTGKASEAEVNWTATKNPDNITGSEGVLLEGFFQPLTVAMAAGGFTSKLNLTDYIKNTNTYGIREDKTFRYGARVGYDVGPIGRINASYIIEGRIIADSFGFKRDSSDLVAKKADGEIYDNFFGLYGSFTFSDNFRLTVGYNGVLTAYLSEYYNQASSDMVKTGYPVIFKNGLNVNARIKMNPFTLRTDNCLSYWEDKDYRLFETGNTGWTNKGLDPSETADRYSAIGHFVIWDGIGLSYPLTQRFSLGTYIRNLLSIYSAEGTVPSGKGSYTFIRDELSFDVSASYAVNSKVEGYIKLNMTNKSTFRSLDLNSQSPGYFINYINNNSSTGAPKPIETNDNELIFCIPIGITLRF